jgi:hypothetical protein
MQSSRHLLSSNGRNIGTYCLQMAKLSTLSSNGKMQRSRHLLSSNGRNIDTYCLQTAKPFKPTPFKPQKVRTYYLQMAKPSTHIFKRQNRRYLLPSNGKTVETHSLQMEKLSTLTVFK